jgi:hypothetical protein
MPMQSKTVQWIQLERGNETLTSREGGISSNLGMQLVRHSINDALLMQFIPSTE